MKTLSILVNKTATFVLKFIHRGGSLPGQLALKVDKNILKQLKIKGKVIVVTGTNGKTTVTHLLQKIFEEDKQQCALIGTLGYKTSSKEDYKEAVHTTPQAPELQAVINRIKSNEIKHPNSRLIYI